MDANALAIGLGGLLQPWVQEVITRGRFTGKAGHAVTMLSSLVIAAVAIWLTGGLVGLKVPAFSLADPSPLLGFLVARWAPIYALSQVVYQFAPSGTVERLSGTGSGS